MTMSVRFSLIALICLMAALSLVPLASAQAASTLGVVNIQEIMKESKAAGAIRTQVKAQQKKFQDELDKKEKALQKEDQDLAKQRSVLSQEAFQKKYEAFRKKAAEAQSEVRKKKSKLDKGFTEALKTIQVKVASIVESIAKEKKLDVVISNAQALYVAPSHDITKEVLSRLNSQLPTLKVSFN